MRKIKNIFYLFTNIVNFHIAVLDMLGLKHGKVNYFLRKPKLKFFARAGSNDIDEIVVVTSGKEYDINKISLFGIKIVLDLGAHIGTFSVYYSNILNNVTVYSVEPDKENFKMLKKNLLLNNSRNVVPINCAIGIYNGYGYLEKNNRETDSYYLNKNKNKKNCKVVTIENFCRQQHIKKIDILKMDIEGSEYDIFMHKKSYEFIKKNVKYIFVEVHSLNKKFNMNSFLKRIEKDFLVIGRRYNVITLKAA